MGGGRHLRAFVAGGACASLLVLAACGGGPSSTSVVGGSASTGDLTTASGVGVLVPGHDTTILDSAENTETVRRFVAAGGGDVAMITYLGGPFPTGGLWNAAKAAEKHERTSVLDGVSERMPSLALAQKLLGKAAPDAADAAEAAAPAIVPPDQAGPAA